MGFVFSLLIDGMGLTMAAIVFKEGYEFDTMEMLHDEKVAGKHLELL